MIQKRIYKWAWSVEQVIQKNNNNGTIHFKHLITVPVVRTSGSAWLYKRPCIACQKIKSRTSMTHIACELKMHEWPRVVRSFMHPWQGTRWQLGMRSCIMPGWAHLVLGLNVCTVNCFWLCVFHDAFFLRINCYSLLWHHFWIRQ